MVPHLFIGYAHGGLRKRERRWRLFTEPSNKELVVEITKPISELTRQDIFDAVRVEGIDWPGLLEEPEFLSRIWDLEKLPLMTADSPTQVETLGSIELTT